MRLYISNLGPIVEASLDFSKINIIIGKNASGKSMTFKFLYALLKSIDEYILWLKERKYLFLTQDLVDALRREKDLEKGEVVEKNILNILFPHFKRLFSKYSNRQFPFIFAKKLKYIFLPKIKTIIRDHEHMLKYELDADFVSVKGFIDRLGTVKASLYLTDRLLDIIEIKLVYSQEYTVGHYSLRVTYRYMGREVVNNIFIGLKVGEKEIQDVILASIDFLLDVLRKIVPKPIYIIDNRSGVELIRMLMKPFALLRPSTTSNLLRETLGGGIVDYARMLDRLAMKLREYSTSLRYQEYIQRHFGGKLRFDASMSEFYFEVDEGLTLPLIRTASGLLETFPILVILGLIEKRRNMLVIIEEPEAHLHPGAQIDLLRIFSGIIKDNNIKIIMSTHSDWFIKAIDELIAAKRVSDDIKKRLGLHGIDIHPEDIRVFLYNYNKGERGYIARKIEVDEEGVSETDFSRINNELYDRYVYLLSIK